MHRAIDADKTGRALSEQRFQMLEDIAQELQGEIVFPTCFDVAVRLRELTADENVSLDQLLMLLNAEPLIPTRLLRMANSASINPGGPVVRDVRSAVTRLGLKTVRSVTLAIAIKQLIRSREMADFQDLAGALWEHSLLTASAAYVVAGKLTRLNPDEALYAGLIHDLGAFYMLYRATRYEELRVRPDTVRYLVAQWHENIGVSLVEALRVPAEIIDAIRDHDEPREMPAELLNLRDVVYVSNLIAGGGREWLMQESGVQSVERPALDEAWLALEPEIRAHAQAVRALFE